MLTLSSLRFVPSAETQDESAMGLLCVPVRPNGNQVATQSPTPPTLAALLAEIAPYCVGLATPLLADSLCEDNESRLAGLTDMTKPSRSLSQSLHARSFTFSQGTSDLWTRCYSGRLPLAGVRRRPIMAPRACYLSQPCFPPVLLIRSCQWVGSDNEARIHTCHPTAVSRLVL